MKFRPTLQFFSFDYPPNDGGIARLCEAIVRGLTDRGIAVEVLTQRRSSAQPPAVDTLVPTQRVTARRPLRELAGLWAMFSRRHSVCITGICYPEGLISHLIGSRGQVILAHGAEIYSSGRTPAHRVRKLLLDRAMRRASCIVANSHFTARLVSAAFPGARVIPVPLAVDHQHFRPHDRVQARARWNLAEDARAICSVSRVHRFKGHETVLNALARLSPELRGSFVYLVAGKGPDIPYFQARARELGVADQVRWLGFVSDEDLPSLYSAVDAFVLMTREIPEERSVEGFGLVFLEAQACGTPAIGTRTGGIPDAISHEDGGWLLDEDDDSGLAGLLLDLHRDPEAFREMGVKARQRVEREFTWDHYLDRFMAALEAAGIHLHGR